jgi:DNA-binding transcriptional MocR family regulator
VLRALLGHGDRVVVERPTYPNTIDALRRSGARLVPLAIDPDGWDATESARTIRAAGASLAVLIPDFHNPTGALMGDDARATLARALTASSTIPVIDETIVEVDLDDADPIPLPFAAHDPRAICVGSSSKSHWGGLRTGWIRAPKGTLPALVEARVTTDLGAPVLEQLVLLELMRTHPGLSPQRRLDLRASRGALADALRTHLPQISFRMPRGGLSLWCELPEDVDATSVAVAAEDAGLLVAAGPRFAVVGGLDRWIRVPFVLPPEVMVDAVARLAGALESARAPLASGRVAAPAANVPDASGRRRPLVA